MRFILRLIGVFLPLLIIFSQTERVISVDFSDLERIEYDKLEVSAREFYVSFKSLHGQSFGKHYLKLLQKLAPLRTSCSGGQVSVDDYCAENLKKSNDHDDENEVDNKQLFSDFSFESKLSILIAELERIRIDDKTCEYFQISSTELSLGRICEYNLTILFYFSQMSHILSAYIHIELA